MWYQVIFFYTFVKSFEYVLNVLNLNLISLYFDLILSYFNFILLYFDLVLFSLTCRAFFADLTLFRLIVLRWLARTFQKVIQVQLLKT